jgi:hypothetical protein
MSRLGSASDFRQMGADCADRKWRERHASEPPFITVDGKEYPCRADTICDRIEAEIGFDGMRASPEWHMLYYLAESSETDNDGTCVCWSQLDSVCVFMGKDINSLVEIAHRLARQGKITFTQDDGTGKTGFLLNVQNW